MAGVRRGAAKTIDAATIHWIRPLTAERTATLNTDRNFAFEIRTINGDGAFVEAGISLENLVAGFAKIGEELISHAPNVGKSNRI